VPHSSTPERSVLRGRVILTVVLSAGSAAAESVLFCDGRTLASAAVGTGVFPITLLLLNWPLSSYIRGVVLAGVGLLSKLGVSIPVWTALGDSRLDTVYYAWDISAWATGASVTVTVLAMGLLQVVAVYIRRKLWPLPGPGQCRGCGYTLFGLPTPICPECGRSFSYAEATIPTNSTRSHSKRRALRGGAGTLR